MEKHVVSIRAGTPHDNKNVILAAAETLLEEDCHVLLRLVAEDIKADARTQAIAKADGRLYVFACTFVHDVAKKAYALGVGLALERVITGEVQVGQKPYQKGDPK